MINAVDLTAKVTFVVHKLCETTSISKSSIGVDEHTIPC